MIILAVGLRKWKTTIVHQLLAATFKNVLKTFDDEIFETLKNIQPQPKHLTVL